MKEFLKGTLEFWAGSVAFTLFLLVLLFPVTALLYAIIRLTLG